jgi:hypothetical protein
MESLQLLPKTYALLAKCDQPLNEIAKGADVGLEWLKKFRAHLIPNPGVNNVQALHDYLVRIQAGARKGGAGVEARAG